MKVTAPLFSLDASGSIGGAITASKWKGRNYMRRLVTPANPRSATQVSTRAVMRFLSTVWATLDPVTVQSTWDALAAQGNYSAFNAFTRQNLKSWTQFQLPSQIPTRSGGTAPTVPTLAVTGGVGQATIEVGYTALQDGWGIALFRGTANSFTQARDNLIYMAAITANPTVIVDTPVLPGTWWYSAFLFTAGGDNHSGGSVYDSGVVT